MITKKELEDYARFRNIKNSGHAEKDYFQNIILFILSQHYGNNMIFKGGTALNKCYGLDRFSEDLDFTCKEKIDPVYIEEDLKRFKTAFTITKEENKNSLKIILHIQGPLYAGIKNSMCRLVIDMSLRETIVLQPTIKTIGRFLEEIPSFDILVMNENEIFAEKIRAIMTRNKARDLYDLLFLINRGIKFNKELTEEKLKFYEKKWNKNQFEQAIAEKKNIWESELKPLISHVPDFKKISHEIIEYIT